MTEENTGATKENVEITKKENGEIKEKEDVEEMDSDDKTPKDADASSNNSEKKEADSAEICADKEPKKKHLNWPLREIKEPHENDVLYGRGGGTNHHPGNKRYRKIVEEKKICYVNSKRLDKPLVALEIIKYWRGQDPPGRFLKNNEKTGLWEDVGDKKAREKTSQALREKAPEIRRKQEEDEAAKHDTGSDNEERKEGKTTRFEEGTNDKRMSNAKRSVLARGHSLGTEYIPAGEAVTLKGFSWDEGVDGRALSIGSLPGITFPGRNSSASSRGAPNPYYSSSRAGSYSSAGPPPPGVYCERSLSGVSAMSLGQMDDRSREYSVGSRYESWGRFPSTGSLGGGSSMGQFPPMGPPQPIHYASSDQYPSVSHGSGPAMSPPQRHDAQIARDHSLSGVPLRDASLNHPAVPFNRYGSGYWGNHSIPPPPPPHGMSGPYPSPGRYRSSDSGYGRERPPSGSYNHMMHHNPNIMGPPAPMPYSGEMGYEPVRTRSGNNNVPPLSRSSRGERQSASVSPSYGRERANSDHDYSRTNSEDRSSTCKPVGHPNFDVDPAIAKTWSSQSDDYDKVATMFGHERSSCWEGQTEQRNVPPPDYFSFRGHDGDNTGMTFSERDELPRPDMVKRMTSNQNEDESNKRGLAGGSVKRAALNRDSSAAANALKEQYIPEVLNRPNVIKNREVSVQEMDMLQDSLQQSKLSVNMARPQSLAPECRSSTMDNIAMALMAKPSPVRASSRTSSIDALGIDLDIDSDSEHITHAKDVPRPQTFRAGDRLSTAEYLDIVNEPLGVDESDPSNPLDQNRETSVSDWLNNTDV